MRPPPALSAGLEKLSPIGYMMNKRSAEDPRRPQVKPIVWMRSSRRDLLTFPAPVIGTMALVLAKMQANEFDESIKPFVGRPEFKGGRVQEIVEDYDKDTYRVVAAVKYPEALYVLHSFKKKSKHGRATPKADIELILRRLKDVETYRKEKGYRP
jgi:phage-related protein